MDAAQGELASFLPVFGGLTAASSSELDVRVVGSAELLEEFGAAALDVAAGHVASVIAHWYRRGLLVGHQRRRQTALWVRLTDDDRHRLDGSSPRQPQMEALPDLIRAVNLTAAQLRTEIQAGRLVPYRLRVNNHWRWYLIRRRTDA